PWRTTKREVDIGDPLYIRAVVRMKELTAQFIQYTNERKANKEEARAIELATPSVEVRHTESAPALRFPPIIRAPAGPEMETITYKRPKTHVRQVAEALGNREMYATEVGKRTFEYFRRVELGK